MCHTIQVKYFFHIGYNGANYRGWQRQPKVVNIQEVIETYLEQVLKEPVSIMGCGRTDAQVHASQYFFHLDTNKTWDFDLRFRLNKNLPDDIAVFDILPMEERCHARFDATQRTYDFFIHTYKDPFLKSVSSLYLDVKLDLDKMKEAAKLLLQYNDFRAFCKTPNDYEHTLCHIKTSELYVDGAGDRLRFNVSADRFLGRMIRIIMARLLQVGQHKLSIDQFEHHLRTKELLPILEVAYPQGLFLSRVIYPYLDVPPRTDFSAITQNRVDAAWQLL